jgi:cell division protein FtsN
MIRVGRQLGLVGVLVLWALGLVAQTDMEKANKYYELYSFRTAAQQYEAILANDPQNTDAVIRLADCYRRVGKYKEAADMFKRAITNQQVHPSVYFNYAKVLNALGRYEDAKVWYYRFSESSSFVGRHFAENCEYALANMKQIAPFNITQVSINSADADFSPAFLGDKLVFSSFRASADAGKGSEAVNVETNNELFVASLDAKSAPKNVQELFKEYKKKINRGFVSYAEQGAAVAFVENNSNFASGVMPVNGSGVKMDIYLANVTTPTTWGDDVPFEHNSANYSNGFPYLSSDAKEMYFSSDRPGGFGGFDLYVSYRQNGGWSAPENLGETVNSPGDEITPFMSEGVLFFASDWHPGFGAFDIFSSTSANGTWTKPINLGQGVNTPQDDYSFIIDGLLGFLVSNRFGGRGSYDIYQVQATTKYKPAKVSLASVTTEPALAIETTPFVALQDGTPLYKGKVVDSETGEGIKGVTIKATNRNSNQEYETLTDGDGDFSVPLEPENVYRISYAKAGYTSAQKTITGPPTSDTKFSLSEQALIPVPIGGDNNITTSVTPPDPTVSQPVVTTTKPESNPTTVPETPKPAETKPTETKPTPTTTPKPAETKPTETKPTPTTTPKPAETKPTETKPTPTTTPKPAETKPTETKPTPTTTPKPAETKPTETKPTPTTTPKPAETKPTETKPTPTTTPKPAETKPTETKPIEEPKNNPILYEVQLGAFAADKKQPEPKIFSPFAGLGKVYAIEANNQVYYRVGVYETLAEANEAIRLAKEKGYTGGSFPRKVTDFSGDMQAIIAATKFLQLDKKNTPAPPVPTPASTTPPTTSTTKPTASSDVVSYKLQIGAFKDASNYQPPKGLTDFGTIEKIKSDDKTIIYLSDFKTSAAAAAVRDQIAKDLNIKTFVVPFKNGKKVTQ